MKVFLISDNVDTQVGMRLAGITGVVVHERVEILRELKKAAEDSEMGIILITEKNAALVKEEVYKVKHDLPVPIIIEIPDRHGSMMEKDRIVRYIRDSIGIKI